MSKRNGVWNSNDFFRLKGPCVPLCMEYDIVQMSAAASYGGTDLRDLLFNDSNAQIRLNMNDSLDYIHFEGIGRLGLIAKDLRLQKAPQKSLAEDQRKLVITDL